MSSPIAITRTKIEADGEHREDDLAAFLGGVGQEQSEASIVRVTIPHAEVVRDTCALDRVVAGGRRARARASGAGSRSLAQLRAGRVERAPAEQRRGRGPRLGLAGPALGARLGAERDELGEVVHRLDAAGRRDPDEPVGVEVVAEQERRVGVGRREEPRPAVVEQVALVDRLHPERERRLAERPRRRATVSRSPAGRSDSAQSGLSAAASAARVSQTSASAVEEVANGLDRPVDLLVAVRERDEHALELGRRQVDAARRAGAGRAPRTARCRERTASS